MTILCRLSVHAPPYFLRLQNVIAVCVSVCPPNFFVFYVVSVVSNESRRLVLRRTTTFFIYSRLRM
jgi:hypothetical protein